MIAGGASSRSPGGRRISVAVGQRPVLQLDALSRELEQHGFDVCIAEATLCRLVQRVGQLSPDLALVHAQLDPLAPLASVTALHEALPGLPVVVMIDQLSPGLAHAALAEKADAVVLGDSSVADLVEVLRRVAGGQAVYPAGWLAQAHRADSESLDARLSPRQLDVLELLAAGHGNAEIARRLNVSPNTVKFHVRMIYQRLGVTNRVQATLLLEEKRLASAAPGALDALPVPPEGVVWGHPRVRSQTTRAPVATAGRAS